MFQFLSTQAQDRYPDIIFSGIDYEKNLLTSKDKNHATEVGGKECNNELSKFT